VELPLGRPLLTRCGLFYVSRINRQNRHGPRRSKKLITQELNAFATRRYDELVALIGHDDVKILKGWSGITYQIETSVFWESQPDGSLRIVASIDDGGWQAFVPLTYSAIMKPDGKLL
jgi:hypothetical protein